MHAAAIEPNRRNLQELPRLATPGLVMRYAHETQDALAQAVLRMPKWG